MSSDEGKGITRAGVDGTQSSIDHEFEEFLELVEDLRSQNDHLRIINKTLQDELDSTRGRARDAKAAGERLDKDLTEYQCEVATLKASVEKFNSDLRASKAERREAAQEIKRLTREVKVTREEVRKREEQIEGLRIAALAYKREVETREHRIRELHRDFSEQVEKLQKRLDTRERELYEAKAANDDLDRENQRLQKEAVALSRARDTIEDLRRKIGGFRDRLLGDEGLSSAIDPETTD